MQISAPITVAHSHVQQLHAPAEAVFPLLCPVREAEWIEGWQPVAVFTNSGFAEENCVFVTGAGAEEAIWTITEYAPIEGKIKFVKTTPGLAVTHITIEVHAASAETCTADITYRLTALGGAGATLVQSYTREHFLDFMRVWEQRLNHFLTTGEMLRSLSGDRHHAHLSTER